MSDKTKRHIFLLCFWLAFCVCFVTIIYRAISHYGIAEIYVAAAAVLTIVFVFVSRRGLAKVCYQTPDYFYLLFS